MSGVKATDSKVLLKKEKKKRKKDRAFRGRRMIHNGVYLPEGWAG